MGGGGGIWQFSLVQGSKIHLNKLWYRLRVPGSQRHITTQKFLKYPPRDYIPLLVQNLSCLCQTVLFCKELLCCLDPDPTPVIKFKNTHHQPHLKCQLTAFIKHLTFQEFLGCVPIDRTSATYIVQNVSNNVNNYDS